MGSRLVFDDGTEALQWVECEPILREVVLSGLQRWPVRSLIVPAGGIHRPQDGGVPGRSGIHAAGPPYRALDGSGRNVVPVKPTQAAQWAVCSKIAMHVNRLWVYDPRRPQFQVAVGKKHGTGPHVHFQVHPRTVRSRDP